MCKSKRKTIILILFQYDIFVKQAKIKKNSLLLDSYNF